MLHRQLKLTTIRLSMETNIDAAESLTLHIWMIHFVSYRPNYCYSEIGLFRYYFHCNKVTPLIRVHRSLVHSPTMQVLCLARTLRLQIASLPRLRWKDWKDSAMIRATLLDVMTHGAPTTMQRLSRKPSSGQPLSSFVSASVCQVMTVCCDVNFTWFSTSKINYNVDPCTRPCTTSVPEVQILIFSVHIGLQILTTDPRLHPLN